MTLQRRVSKLEEFLSPTQLVLRWMAEAHAYRDVPAYVASLLAKDPPVAPLDRLAREAIQGARSANRGKRPEVVDAAVRSALRETVFRYELVLRINVVAHDLVDREALIDAALSAQVALTTHQELPEPRDVEWLGQLRDLLLSRVDELLAMQEARALVQGRYLDGHDALFPDVARAWDEQVRSTQIITDMAVRLAEIDGVPPAVPLDPEALSRRTAELVADLVEPAKAEALDKLGEGQQALRIAAGWVQAKLAPTGKDGRSVTADRRASTTFAHM
jgi:hypothetical protein